MPEEGVEGAQAPALNEHLGTSPSSCEGGASESPRSQVDADVNGPGLGPADPVEAALARALDAAAAAGRFDVVSQLARELEARRLARSENVIPIAPRRQRMP